MQVAIPPRNQAVWKLGFWEAIHFQRGNGVIHYDESRLE
jgi:hypothetical protein